jgi:chaperonin GroES
MTMYRVEDPLDGKEFEMLFNNIMVKRFRKPNVTESGIIMSVGENKVVRRQEGIILAVGPGELMDDGTIRKMELKPGDVVWFGEWAGVEFEIPDDEDGYDQVLFMKDCDVVARIVDRKADA